MTTLGVILLKHLHHRWLCAIVLATFAVAARSQESNDVAQSYSHIQDLNNAGAKIILGSPDTVQLLRALAYLRQSTVAISQLQAKLSTDSAFAEQVESRRGDNLRFQAYAYAKLGDKQAALDRLDAWAADGVFPGERQFLMKDQNLVTLRDDPRFLALVSRIDRLASRWDANAFMAPNEPLSEAQRIAGLSLFWSEVRYNFAHFDHVSDLQWNQTYLDFLPRVIAARSLHDYYEVLMQLAPLLRDGHTNIYPPQSIQDQFYASPPIATELIQNRVLITRVADPDLVAHGIHVGDEILAVDGIEVHQYAREHVEPYVSSSTPQDLAARMYGYRLLDGDHAQPVMLTLEDGSGEKLTVTLSREPDPAVKRKPAFEFRSLPDGIAYLSLGEFANDRGAKVFEEHLTEILTAKGLILDVRSNGGGSTGNGLEILSWLTNKPIPLPVLRSLEYVPTYRAWSGPSEQWKLLGRPDDTYTKPHNRHFTGPVAVLIGPRTFSAAEDFVVSFAAMKRGILVGQATAGSSGQPLVFKLPGGGLARVCSAQETFPSGREFVGIGITPQIMVEPSIADVRAGRDPVIVAAARALLETHSVIGSGVSKTAPNQ